MKLAGVQRGLDKWKKQRGFQYWKKGSESKARGCYILRGIYKNQLRRGVRERFEKWRGKLEQARQKIVKLVKVVRQTHKNEKFKAFQNWKNEIILEEVQSERAILGHNQILFQFQIGLKFLRKIVKNSNQSQKRQHFDSWRLKTQKFKNGVTLLSKVMSQKQSIFKCQSLSQMRISLKDQLHSERREVMRSECDVLASQTTEKQQESQHYFSIMFQHVQQRIKENFGSYDFSKKG